MKKYKYFVYSISTRTGGTFQQELEEALEAYAKEGWRLHKVIDSITAMPKTAEELQDEVKEKRVQAKLKLAEGCDRFLAAVEAGEYEVEAKAKAEGPEVERDKQESSFKTIADCYLIFEREVQD
jgi:hypothetical protein